MVRPEDKIFVDRKVLARRGPWTLYEYRYQRRTGGQQKELMLDGPQGKRRTTMDAAMAVIEAEGQEEMFR